MRILAIDPGPKYSAFVEIDTEEAVEGDLGPVLLFAGKERNDTLLDYYIYSCVHFNPNLAAIEEVANYGMAVGKEVFDTCRWSGRFEEALNRLGPPLAEVRLVPRVKVKMYMCGSARAKDANIRQAVIDLYGGKEAAIGTKKKPGPLYGVKADVWQALALALTVADISL